MDLAIDVQIPIPLPANIRAEWHRKRDFHCTCGFPGKHPMCNSCGLAIGPEHAQRNGGWTPIPIFADTLNETTGVWEVREREEDRLVCASCFGRIREGIAHLQPIRQTTRLRRRLVALNGWRRNHHLPLLTEHSPLADL